MSSGQCNSRFCPVNSNPTGNILSKPADSKRIDNVAVVAPNPDNSQLKRSLNRDQAPKSADPPPSKLPSNKLPIDYNQMERNRHLRQVLEQNEARKYQQEALARKELIEGVDRAGSGINGNQEAAKLRLLITLQKLQTMGIKYAYISDYFNNCFKGRTMTDGNLAIISSILIFDKMDLSDSDSCYTNAIRAINKTTSTNFGVIYQAIESLSDIVKDFKN